MNQGNLFATKELTGREKAWAEFISEHPFLFHQLRVKDGQAWHHNTLYKGYNDESGYEVDTRMMKRIICNTAKELKEALNYQTKVNQVYYVFTTLDWNIVESIIGEKE